MSATTSIQTCAIRNLSIYGLDTAIEKRSVNVIIGISLSQLLLDFLGVILELLLDNNKLIVIAVLITALLFALCRSYWCPVLYVKNLTQIGYEHIPPGPHRALAIARSQAARQLGERLPPPYPNGWFAVAESRDLCIGHLKPCHFLGQNLCVYRGYDGRAYCLDAYCPHEGLDMSVLGHVYYDCIVCPCHGWRFHSSGEVIKEPGLNKPEEDLRVRSWLTVEVDGAVWIWHDAEGDEPRWLLESGPEPAYWNYRGRNEYVVNSHIQDIPENGADVAHLNVVHSPTLLTGLGEKYPHIQRYLGVHVWAAQWSRCSEEEGDHMAQMSLTHAYTFSLFTTMKANVSIKQIGPGHVRLYIKTVVGPMMITQSVTPVSPLEQRVVHRIFSPTYNAPFSLIFLYAESYMFERDMVIWNSKRYVSSPAYVKGDKTIRLYRKWFSQFYSRNSTSFPEAWRKHCDPLMW